MLLLCLSLACAAGAAPSVRLAATLAPEHLGAGTTVGFTFTVTPSSGLVPPPLVGVELRYPRNLGFALSGLGLATCDPATLERLGPKGCPANSHMGFGAAVAELAAEGLIVRERATMTIVRGPTSEGHLALLFYADGARPVRTQIVFPGLLLPSTPPFGGTVSINVPLVESWPEAPDISIVELHTTLGPEHLTYQRSIGGRTVPYSPQGILLPRVCPRGGFRFAGTFIFLDGSRASARTAVPCPSAKAGR